MAVFFLFGILAVVIIAAIFFAGYMVGASETEQEALWNRLQEMERINPEGYRQLLAEAAENKRKSFDKYV